METLLSSPEGIVLFILACGPIGSGIYLAYYILQRVKGKSGNGEAKVVSTDEAYPLREELYELKSMIKESLNRLSSLETQISALRTENRRHETEYHALRERVAVIEARGKVGR